MSTFDPKTLRADFPVFAAQASDKPFIYLDNAATTQKPWAVLNAIQHHYIHHNANVHRASYQLSQQATQAFEQARIQIQHFIHAQHTDEIIWCKGTTEAINQVAFGWALHHLTASDTLLVSAMEHHANLVPWQQISQRSGARLCIIPLDASGGIDQHAYQQLLQQRPRLIALAHVSNVSGVINPIADMIRRAHQVGAKVLIDGAQAVAHIPVNVHTLDADFYAFSGHKLYGPDGIGVLYARRSCIAQMHPCQFGGDMVDQVTYESATWQKAPLYFEAGTPPITGAVGLAAAVSYLNHQRFSAYQHHEHNLYRFAEQQLQKLPVVIIAAHYPHKTGALSFYSTEHHPHDIALWLDQHGIAVRAGFHCAMPLVKTLHPQGVVRLSLGLYNTQNDIEHLITALTALLSHSSHHPTATTTLHWPDWLALTPQYLRPLLNVSGRTAWYQALTKLAKLVPALPANYQTTNNLIPDCASRIWLHHQYQAPHHYFAIFAESRQIMGLAALLLAPVNGKDQSTILTFDFTNYFKQWGVLHYFNTSKKNALHSIIAHITQAVTQTHT